MNAIRLPNGNLNVPATAEAPGTIGDGRQVIGPEHPDFERWAPFARDAEPGEGGRVKVHVKVGGGFRRS